MLNASSRMRLNLSKAISAEYAAEEFQPREILRSQPTADIDQIFKKETE